MLHLCEWISPFSSTRLVTDARAIHDYYLAKYGSESTVIGYGSEMPAGDDSLNGFNLESGRYVLYVSRLEPENNPDLVLRSWRNVRSAHCHVWQRRFYDMNIWSEKKRFEKLNYMHGNPVKRGLVSSPDQWSWSSFRFYNLGDESLLKIDRMP